MTLHRGVPSSGEDLDLEICQTTTTFMQDTITNSLAVEATDYNNSKPPIPVEDLEDHINQLSANENFSFSEEYQVQNSTVSIATSTFFGFCNYVYTVCVCVSACV